MEQLLKTRLSQLKKRTFSKSLTYCNSKIEAKDYLTGAGRDVRRIIHGRSFLVFQEVEEVLRQNQIPNRKQATLGYCSYISKHIISSLNSGK